MIAMILQKILIKKLKKNRAYETDFRFVPLIPNQVINFFIHTAGGVLWTSSRSCWRQRQPRRRRHWSRKSYVINVNNDGKWWVGHHEDKLWRTNSKAKRGGTFFYIFFFQSCGDYDPEANLELENPGSIKISIRSYLKPWFCIQVHAREYSMLWACIKN